MYMSLNQSFRPYKRGNTEAIREVFVIFQLSQVTKAALAVNYHVIEIKSKNPHGRNDRLNEKLKKEINKK